MGKEIMDINKILGKKYFERLHEKFLEQNKGWEVERRNISTRVSNYRYFYKGRGRVENTVQC